MRLSYAEATTRFEGERVTIGARIFPPGAHAYFVTEDPAMAEEGSIVAAGPLACLVLIQDTGGAIRGTGRIDFFWGRGDHRGRLFVPGSVGLGRATNMSNWEAESEDE